MAKNPHPSVNEIIRAIKQKYHCSRRRQEWIMIQELRVGSGYAKANTRSIDFWALNCWPSKGHHAIAYEIKRSRSDFLSDLKHANAKHRGAKAFSNEFYYVAPKDMIKVEDLPPWAGLIEVKAFTGGIIGLVKIHPAKVREKGEPSWGLICSILRRRNKISEG